MDATDENQPEFDKSARSYEALFKPWLKLAGAPREYFARTRMDWLASLLRNMKFAPKRVLDFGCGTGMSLSLLGEVLAAEEIIGLDPSEESLAVAREGGRPMQLATPEAYLPQQNVDLVFCNGVFHHIPLAERAGAIGYIYRCLRPGGIFALWENNPWNPVHDFAMRHSEIDKNAIPVPPPESRRLIALERFETIRTDYLFFFPGYFSWLRPVERMLIKLPVGAQYQVLARKA
jgi:SAM-dependent methyltransferase